MIIEDATRVFLVVVILICHDLLQCLGAIHQLCIRDIYPNPYAWYNYILCVNQRNGLIPDWGQVERCAEVIGLLKNEEKWERVRDCVDGKRGRELLGRSVKKAAETGVR